MKNAIYLLLACFVSLMVSCESDNNIPINQISNPDEGETPEFTNNFGNATTRTFLGQVIDINSNPIEGATITIGSSTALTDAQGMFVIADAPIFQYFGYVKAEKTGYLTGSRSVIPTEGTNHVKIMLLDAYVTSTVASGSEATVSLGNGASVQLPGNYALENGTAYSGNVNVVLHHLDPTDDNMQYQMPGMLYAANSEDQERMLQTFGMLAVELISESGETLNLAEGSTAEIIVPLDASLINNAPATIPLWHFNETHGYWVEDGEATLEGNAYIGTVTHFSFWNCDIPAEAVNLCLNVTDDNGNALSNLTVTITSTNFGTTYGYTNELGQVCGLVPSNETLELNIFSYDICGTTALYTETVGAFTGDTSQDITVSSLPSNIISETVTGTFNTCDDNPVPDGYIFLYYQNQGQSALIDNGSFEFNLLRCDQYDTFKLVGNDYINLQTTDTLNYTFTTPLTNIGTISACNTVDEFIQYSIDNGATDNVTVLGDIYTSFNENNPQFNNMPAITISGSNGGTSCFYAMGILNPSPYLGTYDSYDWNSPGDTGFNIQECIDISSNINISYNLNTLGTIGEYIDINFSGSYDDSQGNPHTINGVIHVLRDN